MSSENRVQKPNTQYGRGTVGFRTCAVDRFTRCRPAKLDVRVTNPRLFRNAPSSGIGRPWERRRPAETIEWPISDVQKINVENRRRRKNGSDAFVYTPRSLIVRRVHCKRNASTARASTLTQGAGFVSFVSQPLNRLSEDPCALNKRRRPK